MNCSRILLQTQWMQEYLQQISTPTTISVKAVKPNVSPGAATDLEQLFDSILAISASDSLYLSYILAPCGIRNSLEQQALSICFELNWYVTISESILQTKRI